MFTPLGLLQTSWWAFISSSSTSQLNCPLWSKLQYITSLYRKKIPLFFLLFLNLVVKREEKRIFLIGNLKKSKKEAIVKFRTESFLQCTSVKSISSCCPGSVLIPVFKQNFTHHSSAELFDSTQCARDCETSPFLVSFCNINALDLGLSYFLIRFTGRVC